MKSLAEIKNKINYDKFTQYVNNFLEIKNANPYTVWTDKMYKFIYVGSKGTDLYFMVGHYIYIFDNPSKINDNLIISKNKLFELHYLGELRNDQAEYIVNMKSSHKMLIYK